MNQLIKFEEETYGYPANRFTVVINRVSKFNRSCKPLQRRIYINEKDRVNSFQVSLFTLRPHAPEQEKSKVANPAIKINIYPEGSCNQNGWTMEKQLFRRGTKFSCCNLSKLFSQIFVFSYFSDDYFDKLFCEIFPSAISCAETQLI